MNQNIWIVSMFWYWNMAGEFHVIKLAGLKMKDDDATEISKCCTILIALQCTGDNNLPLQIKKICTMPHKYVVIIETCSLWQENIEKQNQMCIMHK